MEALRASARAVVVSVSVVTVVDDDSKQRSCSWEEIRALAREARGLISPGSKGPVPAGLHRVLHAAALLAELLMGRDWLREAARATGEALERAGNARPRSVADFLRGCLKNHCATVASVELVGTDAEIRTWFSSLMYPAEKAVERYCPPAAPAETAVAAAAAEPPMTAEQWREARAATRL